MIRVLTTLFLASLVLSTGCGRDTADAIRVPRWSLRVNGAGAARSVELPIRLDEPSDPESTPTYRFETEVRLPRRMWGRTIWFVVPELAATSRLVVDGERASSVARAPWDIVWTSGPHVFEIRPDATRDGRVALAWSVHRVWRLSDAINAVPELHPEREFGSRASIALGFGLVAGSLAVGAVGMLGFAGFIMWWARREDRVGIFLALGAVSAGGLFAFEAGWAQLFGGVRSIFVIAASYSVGIVCVLVFTSRWFHVNALPRWFFTLPVAAIVTTVAGWTRPSQAFVTTVPIVVIAAVIALTIHVVILRPGLPGSDARRTSVWLGWIVLAISAVPEVLYYSGFGDLTGGLRTATLGIFVWGCTLQQAMMSSRVADLEGTRSALDARALDARRENDGLEVMKRDLERLARRDADVVLRALESTASRRKGPRLRPGAIVDDRYEVLGTLGIGGMGSVYEVRRLADDERFALKVAHHLDGETLARLAREAWVAATVQSSHVIAIYDVGVASEGYLFFVMERFPGAAASSSAYRYGDVPWALRVLADCARGLVDLHEAGIVHRDLKPPNILVADTPEGPVAKVADFGISRFDSTLEASGAVSDLSSAVNRSLSERAQKSKLFESISERPGPYDNGTPGKKTPSSLTRAGAIAGTMAYMAPEVARGTTAVAREADIFGFGVIAYEMLVGQRPFSTVAEVDGERIAGAKLAASIEARGVPIEPRLLKTLDACLAFDARRRPTAKELVRAFEKAAEERAATNP